MAQQEKAAAAGAAASQALGEEENAPRCCRAAARDRRIQLGEEEDDLESETAPQEQPGAAGQGGWAI